MDIAGWENLYRSGERGSEDRPTVLLVEALKDRAAGSAIDLACGAGRNAIYLASRGWKVTAIDGSSKAIDLLAGRAGLEGLSIQAQVADLTADTFVLPADAVDLVLIAYYLQRDLFPRVKASGRHLYGHRSHSGTGREREREASGAWRAARILS